MGASRDMALGVDSIDVLTAYRGVGGKWSGKGRDFVRVQWIHALAAMDALSD